MKKKKLGKKWHIPHLCKNLITNYLLLHIWYYGGFDKITMTL
jgi:hypothetical protein